MAVQISIFKRIFDFVLGRSHAALDRIENPEDQIRVFVDDLNSEIKKLQQSVTMAVADEKKMKMRIEDLLAKSSDWEKKAILALDAGQEDLAKEALVKKEDCDSSAVKMRSDWEKQKAITDTLKKSLNASHDRVDEAKRQYTVLIAQYRNAKTNQDLNKKFNELSSDSPMQMIESLKDKIIKIEAETEAEAEMHGSNADMDVRFRELEKKQTGELALAKLKASMADRKQLASGPTSAASIEDLKAKVAGRK